MTVYILIGEYERSLMSEVFGAFDTEEKTAESITDPNSLYSKIEFAVKASTGTDEYMVGFRNGLRYALYLLDGKAPKYEFVTVEETQQDGRSCQAYDCKQTEKPKDDDISTYQEYSYIRHPDRVEMGMY